MEHAGQLQVVAVVAEATDEARVFLTQHAPIADRLLVVVDKTIRRPVSQPWS